VHGFEYEIKNETNQLCQPFKPGVGVAAREPHVARGSFQENLKI